MKNNFFNYSVANIYSKPSSKSEVISQILYGEKFKIIEKKKDWYKIRNNYDDYIGFIKKKKFRQKFEPTNKIYKLKSKIYKKKNNKFISTNNFLYFASGICVKKRHKNFIEFEKNKWLKINDTKKINHYENNFIKVFKLFLGSKYLWGGKTSIGIDCSALIQIYFYYNRIFFPRDTKDQIKFIKRNKNFRLYKKDKLMYWKGHVAYILSKNLLIHAYGPKKKVIIMKKNKTIDEIKKNTNRDLKLI